ncbi:MAG TPA: glycosyltransferase, partial [Gemmatimonadaceae bacterium]
MAQAGSPRRQERLTRIVAATSLAFSLVYIVWRWGWTLNTEALWFSVPLAVAETYGLLTAFFLAFTAWRLKERAPKPPLRGRTVDVFVTTYDEPIGIIRKTALAARELRYPHHTWLLDDGKRDEVRALATELGIGYLRREGREHAKAGNLNHALRNTLGEFILQLDADHVPLPHMIDRLIGHFDDERLAFVQSPQDFYNTDAFTYDVNVRQRRIWEDQQLFFRVLQPGKDRVNAAFFVGSCALIRRAAVEEIGGFATETITEDIETSLLLHARGWRSAYVAESLAYGLAPATARAFHVQHLRWGQGAMQVLRRYRPLFMPGLTLAQRIAYLDSLSTYLGGFQRLILYLAPVVFFTTGTFPLQVSGAQFAIFFLPYISLQLLSFKLLARGHGSLLLADRYAMAKFFTHVLAVTGYLTRKRLAFRVTPKGENQVPLSTVAPQFTVAAVTGLSLLWAVWERTRGYTDEIPGWGASAFWVNVVFALWNGGVAWHIMQLSLGGRRRRSEHRFAEALALSVRVFRTDGKLTATDVGVTENLNPAGLALRTMYPMPEGARVEMTLPLQTRAVEVRGRVVHHGTTATQFGTVHLHGIAFEGLDRESRDAIEMHCAHHAMPIERQRYREGGLTARGVLRRLRDLRAVPRLAVAIPAHVAIGSNGSVRALGVGLLEDVSPRGGRVLLDHPVGEGSLLTLSIPGSAVQASGRVVAVRALETSLGTRFMAGFET